jgi:TolA-binding protein
MRSGKEKRLIMKKVLLCLLFINCLAGASIAFPDVLIVYIEGNPIVDLSGTGKWTAAQMNMQLNRSSIINTGNRGTLELEVDGKKIVIGNEKIIHVNDIYEKVKQKQNIIWFSNIKQILKTVTGKDMGEKSAISLGIRGAREEEEKDILWMGDLEEESKIENLQMCIDLYTEEKYGQAINLLKDLINDEEYLSMRGEMSFYLGASLFYNVQYKEALIYLEECIWEKGTYYYESGLFHYAFAHYLLGRFSESIEGFERYLREFGNASSRPYVLFMLGKSYISLGDREVARRYLIEILHSYKESTVYADAVDELKEL